MGGGWRAGAALSRGVGGIRAARETAGGLMDGMAAIYARALAHARRCAVSDPAIEPGDLLQSAWLKCGALLPGLADDTHRLRLLLRCVSQVALDHQRRAKIRPRAEFGDWLASEQRVEDEAIERIALVEALARPGRGAALARAVACGWTRHEIAAATGVPANTIKLAIWRWQTAARAEVQA